MLHAPPLYPGYTGQAAPNISWIGAYPGSSLRPDTTTWKDKSQCIVRPCSGDGQYITQYLPVPPLPAPLQCVGTPMSHSVDVWGLLPPSTMLRGGETLKGFIQLGVQNPRLGPKHKHRLHHCHIKPPRCSPIHSLPSHDFRQPYPFPRALQRFCSNSVQFFRGRQRSSQVLELRDHCQRCPIHREDPTHTFHHLLNNQPMLFPIRIMPVHQWS